VLAAVAFTVLVSACGGGSDNSGGNADAEPVKELALGTAADVDYYPADYGPEPISSGRVTVTAVRKASIDDLKDAGYSLDPEEEATTPYYVDVTFENSGTVAVKPRRPGGVDSTDDAITPLTLINLGGQEFTPCPGIPDTVEPGATATGCSIVLVPTGNTLERVYYLADASVEDIFWKAE
jgi:hypothetical protein